MGVIKNAIDTAFRGYVTDGVPASGANKPSKTEIRAIGPVIESEISRVEGLAEAASAGLVQASTWSELEAIEGARHGQPGRVAGPDTGTHTDPVSLSTVDNLGEYSWNMTVSPAGWARVGELLVSSKEILSAYFVDQNGFIGAAIDNAGRWRFSNGVEGYELIDNPVDTSTGAPSVHELFCFVDNRGFKAFSLSNERLIPPQDEEFNAGYSAEPIIGGHLVAFEGQEAYLYARNILARRSDLSRIRATLYSEAATDGSRPSYSRTSDDQIVIDLDKCASSVKLLTRLDEIHADLRHEATLGAVSVPVPAGSPNAATVLMIGDSITNRTLAQRMNLAATEAGYALTFIGTINGAAIGESGTGDGGLLGEGREGWQSGDFTYAVTDRVTIIDPGGEAAYLGSSKATKAEQNPFLRAEQTGDSDDVIRNGYVFDFDYYLTRFSLADPDVVFIGLGTNDIRDIYVTGAADAIADGLAVMCAQIQSARPGTKIIIWFPPVARAFDRDALWDSYVGLLTQIVRFVIDEADSDIRLVPVWAMASQEAFTLGAGTTSDTGIASAPPGDSVHLSPFNQARCAEILAAAACGVALGLL